jgi:hypothetical protein
VSGFFIFSLLILIVAIVLSRRLRGLEERIAFLEAREAKQREAEWEQAAAEPARSKAAAPEAPPPVPEPDRPTATPPLVPARPPLVTRPAKPPPAVPAPFASEAPPPIPAVESFSVPGTPDTGESEVKPGPPGAWQNLERQIIQNWTGILGAAILVAGVAFIGISVALHISPFLRTAMIAAGAAGLAGISWYLRERPNWSALATWLRSSSAAIFLFACFGSGALPALRWIDNPWLALSALVLGIGVNLYIAWAGATQAFSSLHVVLSLIPIFIIPQSRISLLLATVVALAGVGLAYRSRWDRHLLATLAAYTIFHTFWSLQVGIFGEASELRLTVLACAIVVGVAAALVHYREDYRSKRLEKLPFLVHLTNWGIVGYAGLLYSQQTMLRGVALMTGGVLAFLLARRGKTLGVRWVHLTDTLVAQGLVALGILSFHQYVFDPLLVVAFLFAETALFLRVILTEDEGLLRHLGLAMLHISGAALIGAGLIAIELDGATGDDLTRAMILMVSAAVGVAIHVYFLRTRGEEFDSSVAYPFESPGESGRVSILGILMGPMVFAGLLNLGERLWVEYAALTSVGLLAVLAGRLGSRGLAIGAWIALVVTHLKTWAWITQHPDTATTATQLNRLLPMALLSALAIRFAPEGSLRIPMRRLGIYVLGTHVAMGAYFVTQPYSPLIPGVLWLTLSLVALETANRLRQESASAVLHIGYAYVAGFLAQYALIYLQAQSYFGPFPVRLLVEIFGVAALGYWWMYRPGEGLGGLKSWVRIHPLFLEAALLFFATAVVVEAAPQARPLIWCGLAFVCLAGPLSRSLASRFRFYSVFFFWGAAADLAIVTSGFAAPSPRWFEHPGIMGSLAILLMIGWLVRSHGRLDLDEAEFPAGLEGLASWSGAVAARTPLWVYYPFVASVALFFYWRFDHSVLTLLWSAEAFAIFILSAVLREEHFRYMALVGMGACVIRLIGFDMAQSDTLMRGLVFLGVGILMLSMNSIYNRFRARFQ